MRETKIGESAMPVVFAALPTVTDVSRSAFFGGKVLGPGAKRTTSDTEHWAQHAGVKKLVPATDVPRLLLRGEGHTTAGGASQEALSLVADFFDQQPEAEFRPEAAPDIVKTLLEEFVQGVPSSAHRAALEACALVRLMTESLLAMMLKQQDAHELFEWLRGLSFIEADRRGIFPHDLAREALTADLKWRDPDGYAELHTRARGYYMQRVQHGAGPDQRRLLADYIYLHRDNPSVRPFFLLSLIHI